MILIDANILLYAYDSLSEHHRAARKWLEDSFSNPEPVRLSWATILAFMRIRTNQRLWKQPTSVPEAVSIVEEWLAQPNVAVLAPGERYWSTLKEVLSKSQARGPLITDAHLAALAIEHGALLCTTDRDFARFPGLRWSNPLEPAR